MKLLILGINRAPEPIGIAPYTTELGRWLAARGHEVAMVSAQPYYPAWRLSDGYPKYRWTRAMEDGVSVTRCPIYVPANPSGARRIAHHASFAASALLPMVRRARELRPDVIMAIAPSLLAAPVALAAARLTGSRTWLHIQDLEVDAAFATGLIDADSAMAYRASSFEAWLLRRFDRVSTISSRMGERLMDKGVEPDRIVDFRNWTDTEKIVPLATASSYRSRWNISTPHVALYSGNLANKQGIEIVIEAAYHLRNRNDVTFIICGEGSSRDRVAAEVTNLANVQLHDLQPHEMLNELLGLATVHLLPQVAAAADLMLPSKLTNILASGRPVIASACPGTSLATEVEGCGVVTPPGDSRAFASGIVGLLDNPSKYAAAAAAARARAVERWSRDAILTQVEGELELLTR